MIFSKKSFTQFFIALAITSFFLKNLACTQTESFDLTSLTCEERISIRSLPNTPTKNQSLASTPRSRNPSPSDSVPRTPEGESITPEKNTSRTPKTVTFVLDPDSKDSNKSTCSSTDPDSEEVKESLNRQHGAVSMRSLRRNSPYQKKTPISPISPKNLVVISNKEFVEPVISVNRKLDFVSLSQNNQKDAAIQTETENFVEDDLNKLAINAEIFRQIKDLNLMKLHDEISEVCKKNIEVKNRFNCYKQHFAQVSTLLWSWFFSQKENDGFIVAKNNLRSFLLPPKKTLFSSNIKNRKKSQEEFLNKKIRFGRAYFYNPIEMLAYYCGLFQYIVNNFEEITKNLSKKASVNLEEDSPCFSNKDLLATACFYLNHVITT